MSADKTVRQSKEPIYAKLAAFFAARELLARVRRLFVAFGLLNILIAVPMLFFVGHRDPELRAGAGIALAWLAWWRIRGYRRDRFTTLGTLLEGVALLTAGAGLTNPRVLLGVLYSGLFLRAIYGKLPDVVAVPIVYLSAYLGALYMAEGLNGAVSEGLMHVSGFALTTGMMYLIAVTLSRYDQILARERILAKAGTALVAAQDRQSIHKAVVEAALALVQGDPGARAGLLMGPPERLTVVAAAGCGVDRLVGTTLTLDGLPEPFQQRIQEDQPVELAAAQVESLRPVLPFSPSHNLVLIPMHAKGELQGAISLEGHPWPRGDVKEALQALIAEAALALSSVAFTEHLAHQAMHDSLTGLANRALLRDRLEHALARARRQPRTLAVLFIDLDNFKVVNDSFGHAAGDQVLVAVADRLRRSVRACDTVARLGGDEFGLLLEDLEDPRDAGRVAERVLEELRGPLALDREIAVEASIGIAVNAAGDEDADALLQNADVAMYRAKRRRKSIVNMHEPEMHAAALAHRSKETTLRP